jgi:hypothetical protein
MGYGVSASLYNVRVLARNVPAALKTLKALTKKHPEYVLVSRKGSSAAESLCIAIGAWGYEAVERDVPDIEKLGNGHMGGDVLVECFNGDRWGSDDVLWNTLGPFFEAGGCVDYTGEDSEKWRYTFNGEQAEEEHGSIIWCNDRMKLVTLRDSLAREGLEDYVLVLEDVLRQL